MDDDFLRVAAAGEERHRSIANAPAADVRADFDHLACALEAEDRRGARRRRIVAFALQQIGAIHGRRAHADAHRTVERQRRRVHFADPEDGFVAEMVEDDSAHIGRECIVSLPWPTSSPAAICASTTPT